MGENNWGLVFSNDTTFKLAHVDCCCCWVASVVSDSVRPHRRQPTKAPPSLGFSRQEHWSGLPFPSPMRESEVAQSCPTLCDPMDCSPPGSSVRGIFQARVLEWGAIAFSSTQLLIRLFDFCYWVAWFLNRFWKLSIIRYITCEYFLPFGR